MTEQERPETFVKRYGPAIDLTAKLIQTATIILGVGFAVNEFFLKNSAAEYNKVKLTIDTIVPRGFSAAVNDSRSAIQALKDEILVFPSDPENDAKVQDIVKLKYFKAIAELGTYYKLALGCVQAGSCSDEIARSVLCDDASLYWRFIGEIRSRAGLGEPSAEVADKILGVDSVSLPIRDFSTMCKQGKRNRS
jgi:hypothetical protein